MPDWETGSEEWIRAKLEESIAVKRALQQQGSLIRQIGEELLSAYRKGHSSFWFGNGGSAADAQHLAAEFIGKFYFNRAALAAHALHVNTSALTAIGNDFGYEQVFSRQLEAFGRAGDVAIGLSTSGKSANVLEGLRTARSLGLVTVGLTGHNGEALKNTVDYCICVPSDDTPRIQEAHITIGHLWAETVERGLFGAP
jgi:D-sedoheptulose 7-phosphate isomerase